MTDFSGLRTIDALPGSDAEQGEAATQSPLPAKSLRARLREETRAAHERLDASFDALGRGDPRDYALFLQVNAACLAVLEPLLGEGPLPRAMPALAWNAGRSAAALADLEAMGLRPIAAAPSPIVAPTLAQSVGMAYVLEGSRLGGRMILKGLRKSAGAEPPVGFPALFLQSAGEPERFRDFLGLAEALVVTKSDRDAAVAAADAAFGYFIEATRRARATNEDGGGN